MFTTISKINAAVRPNLDLTSVLYSSAPGPENTPSLSHKQIPETPDYLESLQFGLAMLALFTDPETQTVKIHR